MKLKNTPPTDYINRIRTPRRQINNNKRIQKMQGKYRTTANKQVNSNRTNTEQL